jgi:hypothetical protein
MAGLLKKVEAKARLMSDEARRLLVEAREGTIRLDGIPKVIVEDVRLSVTRWGVRESVYVCGVALSLPNIGSLGRLPFPSAVLTGPEGKVTENQSGLLDVWPELVRRSWAAEVLSAWAGREPELLDHMSAEDAEEVLSLGLAVQVIGS